MEDLNMCDETIILENIRTMRRTVQTDTETGLRKEYVQMAKKVIIVGAGFAGIQAARVLTRSVNVQTVLIDKNSHTTMLPALPDVATGFMKEALVCYPVLNTAGRKITYVNKMVESVNLNEKTVHTGDTVYHYDSLIIAAGSTPSPVKLPGEQASFFHQLGSFDDARKLKNAFNDYLERTSEPRLLFAGTGYTGIELAVCLQARAQATGAKKCPVIMVDPAEQILPFLSESERSYVLELIASRGITVRTGVTITSIDAAGSRLSNGEAISAPFAVWSAGSIAALPEVVGDLERKKDGRIVVNKYLQPKGYPEVFIAGDAAAVPDRQGQPLRKSVNYAYYGGKTSGGNCARFLSGKQLHTFAIPDLGWVIPLHDAGLARLFNRFTMHGTLPLRLHYFMCGFRNYGANRIKTALIALTLFKRKEEIMKNVVKRIIGTPDDRSIGLIALRIFTGIALMSHGYGKVFGNPESFVAGVEKIGFPFPSFFAFAASFSEFFGALLLCCGFFTRVCAFFIVCTMSVAAFIVHGSDPFAQKELALLYLFIALFFMIKGGGTFSIDYLLGRKLGNKK